MRYGAAALLTALLLAAVGFPSWKHFSRGSPPAYFRLELRAELSGQGGALRIEGKGPLTMLSGSERGTLLRSGMRWELRRHGRPLDELQALLTARMEPAIRMKPAADGSPGELLLAFPLAGDADRLALQLWRLIAQALFPPVSDGFCSPDGHCLHEKKTTREAAGDFSRLRWKSRERLVEATLERRAGSGNTVLVHLIRVPEPGPAPEESPAVVSQPAFASLP